MQMLVNGGTEVCDCQLKELPLDEVFAHALSSGRVEENN
jgi:hypothetical protein